MDNNCFIENMQNVTFFSIQNKNDKNDIGCQTIKGEYSTIRYNVVTKGIIITASDIHISHSNINITHNINGIPLNNSFISIQNKNDIRCYTTVLKGSTVQYGRVLLLKVSFTASDIHIPSNNDFRVVTAVEIDIISAG